MAVGPPVDAAMAMNWRGVVPASLRGVTGVACRTYSAGGGRDQTPGVSARTMSSFSRNRLASTVRRSALVCALATKSTAPSSSARNTFLSAAAAEITITGHGQTLWITRRKLKPSILGISRSSVITSGRSCGARRSASLPSTAVPTTSMSPAFCRADHHLVAIQRRVVHHQHAQHAPAHGNAPRRARGGRRNASSCCRLTSSSGVSTDFSDSEWPSNREAPGRQVLVQVAEHPHARPLVQVQ